MRRAVNPVITKHLLAALVSALLLDGTRSSHASDPPPVKASPVQVARSWLKALVLQDASIGDITGLPFWQEGTFPSYGPSAARCKKLAGRAARAAKDLSAVRSCMFEGVRNQLGSDAAQNSSPAARKGPEPTHVAVVRDSGDKSIENCEFGDPPSSATHWTSAWKRLKALPQHSFVWARFSKPSGSGCLHFALAVKDRKVSAAVMALQEVD